MNKGFYGLSDVSTVFQDHIDKVLEFKTPVWLGDIICVNNGTAEDHEWELRDILSILQKAGYRESKKTEIFKKELKGLGYHINKNGVKQVKDKNGATLKLEARKNVKKPKIFSGLNPTSIQIHKQPFQEG